MTFNLRYDSGGIGSLFDSNGWNKLQNPRSARVESIVARWNPDIIGTQEGLQNQINDLSLAFTAYDFWGVGRDNGKSRGEFAGIFYRKERFLLNEAGHFWLSLTPDVPGTVFANSGNNRMVSWVRLTDLLTDKNFLVLNTHWDNASEESRILSAQLMVERTGEMVLPTESLLILGDLNSSENSLEVSTLRKGLWLNDAYRLFHPTVQADEASYHGFSGATKGSPIDFVLIPSGYSVLQATIIRDSFAGLFPSDHFPVQVSVCLDENW